MSDQWDAKLTDLFERVMATAASGGDPRPLQEEYNALLKAMPAGKKKALGLKPMKVTEKTNDDPKS